MQVIYRKIYEDYCCLSNYDVYKTVIINRKMKAYSCSN